MRRLLVVYNPNSSNYVRVKNEVLERLPNISGFMIGKFVIEKAPFEDNVKRLKKVLEDGDVVLSAGGDATAAVSANAILESGKDVTLSVLPYGWRRPRTCRAGTAPNRAGVQSGPQS